MHHLSPDDYRDIVCRALAEDIGTGDVTTEATVAANAQARGVFLVKTSCVVAGLPVAIDAFRQIESSVQWTPRHQDGEQVHAGVILGEVVGRARTLLTAERTALNILQRLSGIATLARRFVDAAANRITILDTRKTTPTLRALEKYAVAAGGATNHRVGLFDAVLIKDNHVRLAGGVAPAVARARAHSPGLAIEVEAQTLKEVQEAVGAGADIILFDNMTPDEIREAVRAVGGRARTEISGGVTLAAIPTLATLGADAVSVGALTHSAPAADISFEIEPL
jgi:nicotinate-nucleotide pyrophosphorylase (carboxylating)